MRCLAIIFICCGTYRRGLQGERLDASGGRARQLAMFLRRRWLLAVYGGRLVNGRLQEIFELRDATFE